jgi:formylglycine-generating enzyme required for sulfatase activity
MKKQWCSLALLSIFSTSINATDLPPAQVQHCDTGMSSARMRSVQNAPQEHQNMVLITGGEFWMGANDPVMRDALPQHRVNIDTFLIDATEVINSEYAEFINATNYLTIAERVPDAVDFPGVPSHLLVPGSVVFSEPSQSVSLKNELQWWRFIPGADWRHPEGPNSNIDERMNHPVVHIAYEDALAYAKWSNKRLPTEAEWEFAARGGLDRQPYVWGKEFTPNKNYQANTFQGEFPVRNSAEDGFHATAPVASFPANAFGLFDMAGNVWEWTSDWYDPHYYQELAQYGVADNPKGPEKSEDPNEPGVSKKVQKGGSYLCTDQYCTRYMPGSRGRGAPDTGSNHVGFRLVRSITDQ